MEWRPENNWVTSFPKVNKKDYQHRILQKVFLHFEGGVKTLSDSTDGMTS